ncbi:hypothetical protein ED733_000374 [Metarhizium rileyi]|uniref:Integral membrane protein n=1 Tax=Metarhizium rileyi (strain RCEF 4871) TaxID=1649241 RepID=A0A5C6G8M9_METRR|nr:hypothetical protein ED733_000374 [Metarhizium rileyi]
MRNSSFPGARWEPSGGPTLALRQNSVAGPFGFLNPTTAIYDIRSNDRPRGRRADLADITDTEKQERAKVRWNARRHVLILPRATPLTCRLEKSTNLHRVLLGIGRMFTLFPYWDVSWLIGVSFTIGCLLFVASGLFCWLPIAYPETAFPQEKLVAGGVSAFLGATLFQIGAVLLILESYNDSAETKFGGALEDLFVKRLGIARRVRNHRPQHFDPMDPSTKQHLYPDNDRRGSTSSVIASSAEENIDVYQELPFRNPNDDDIALAKRSWQWWPSWHDITTHYVYEIGFLASFTMSVGATVFYICGILGLPGIFSNLSDAALKAAYYFPYLLGGVLFSVSSLMYILETQPNWYTPQPFKIGWHVGVWNMIGSLGWTLAASLGYCNASWCVYQNELTLIWASAAFSFGSALQWYESLDKYVVIIDN